jgi:hypothetical protein
MSNTLKVIFHINEVERWDIALGNITNLLKDVGEENVDVRVLANGQAVLAFSEESKIQRMKELSDRGVRFLACRNSLRNLCSTSDVCISEEHLPEFIGVVPAGITELIKRQSEGYAYIKP